MRDGIRRCSLRGTRVWKRIRNIANRVGWLGLTVLVVGMGVGIMSIIVYANLLETPSKTSIISEDEVKVVTEIAKPVEEEVILSSEEPIVKSCEEITTEIMQGNQNEEKLISRVETNDVGANLDEKTPSIEIAARVWNCMKSYGWNDIVCAGILGNIMAEVGGQTFNLDYNSNGGCGYGLCQWTSGRKNLLLEMYGSSPSVEQQVEYIYRELTGDGINRQISESAYNLIMNANTPEECALVFAHKFERCGAAFIKRQQNARKAYETFS